MLAELQDRLMAAAYRLRLRTWFSGREFSAKERSSQRISNPWHAVSVVSPDGTCKAAREAQGRRYLSADAPKVPLQNCDHPGQCQCRYAHHSDRRSGKRRARDNGLPARMHAGSERRHGARGRRASDGYDTKL